MTAPSSKLIWIIAGESSGDNYGAQLASELKSMDPAIRLKGMGGEKMLQAGVELHVDSTELGVVGFIEVLKQIGHFIRLLKFLEQKAAEERPDAVVLIDYPGFNIRLARRLHALHIPVVYYISPQVWAWKKGRIKTLAANTDRMLCIFPFEPGVYKGSGLDVRFVGHPLLQTLMPMKQHAGERSSDLVLLLPGSRFSELNSMLPIMLRAAALLHRENPSLRFEVSLPRKAALDTAEKLHREYLAAGGDSGLPISFTCGHTRQSMLEAAAGMAASGTVTVEAVILGLPLCVTYQMHWLTWRICKMLVKLPWASIANLVSNKCVYEEFLQYEGTPENLARGVQEILPGGSRREAILQDMENTVKLLGGESNVSRTVAENILDVIHDLPSPLP